MKPIYQKLDDARRKLIFAAAILLIPVITAIYPRYATEKSPPEDVLKTATDCIIHANNNGQATIATLKIPNHQPHIIPLAPRSVMNNVDTVGIAPGFRVVNQIGAYDHKNGYHPASLACVFAGKSLTAKNSSGEYYHGYYEGGRVTYNITSPQTSPLAQM